MATSTITRNTVPGTRREVLANLTMSNSYVTGGEPWDALAQLGLSQLDYIDIEPTVANRFVYDRVNKKVLAFTAAGVEVANATNLSAITVVVRAQGIKGV